MELLNQKRKSREINPVLFFTVSSGFPKAKGHPQLQQLDNSV